MVYAIDQGQREKKFYCLKTGSALNIKTITLNGVGPVVDKNESQLICNICSGHLSAAAETFTEGQWPVL